VGFETNDDAGVFQLTPDLALVQTVDFFTPMVDDPYAFGAIAAANALSDVYAMGGTPLTALNILAYPTATLPPEMVAMILKGGGDKAAEAGVTVLGGHTVEDDVPKYGMAVTGTVHPDRVVRNVGGQAGDRLILTKAIGVGILTTGIKRGLCSAEGERAAIASMSTLNKAAGEVLARLGAHACTDISGFGLLGHLYEMVKGSGLGARISFEAVPIFAEALSLAQQDEVPGGTERNLEFLAPHVRFASDVDLPRKLVLADAQTSGGLLFAVAPEQGDALMAALVAAGCGAWEIGSLAAGSGIDVSR
jgi:selenide,water dikinase